MLSSDKIKHGSTIANCCIKVLYNYNPDACQKYIVEIICSPLMSKKSDITESERKIEQCIENLTKCFLPEDAKFKHLPCKVILHIATPLFCLYSKMRKSVYALKMNLRRLLSSILMDETTREKLYSVFLGHVTTVEFGDYVISEFGPTGGIEITGVNEDLEYEELADTVFDLMTTTKDLSPSLFRYMLQYLSNVNRQSFTRNVEQSQVLETEDDKIRRIAMQLAAYKLLSQLASTSIIQDAQVNNPEPLLSFIQSMLHEYMENTRSQSHQHETEETECEILYISLMLIKMILIEKRAVINIDLFKKFSTFLQNCRENMSTQLKSLIDEVVSCIITYDSNVESQDRSKKKYYEDLSTNSAASNKFDEALKDLSDPLLPVRAHGLITFTRLIESNDPCARARKAIILRLFQVVDI